MGFSVFHASSRLESNSPARPRSLAEQIAEAVTKDILAGQLQPGDNIREQHLAARLAVSRGPIREALRILEREGVVVVEPRKGVRVTHLDRAEVNCIYEIRSPLFGRAARHFASRHLAPQIEGLRANHASLQALGPGEEATRQHSELSAAMARIIIDGCGNLRLAQLITALQRQVARYTLLGLSSPERRATSQNSWQALLSAFDTRDGYLAEKIATEMVENTRRFAVLMLEEQGDA